MSKDYDFYDTRAREAAKEAGAATLDNVRERALRSEAAWRDMADRALQVERDRQVANQERAERRAAELLVAQERAAAAAAAG